MKPEIYPRSPKAMILAAGLGTRLRPLTDSIPKALVKVGGQMLLEQAIGHLETYGVKEIIINVHHFANQISDYLEKNRNFGLQIVLSDETDQLLDTGGGLKKASGFFNDGEPFIVRNVDIISDIDLGKMMEYHKNSAALVTLAVRKRETSRYFLFDREKRLCGWTNLQTGEKKITRDMMENKEMLAFSGIQVIDPEIFNLITEEGNFSLTNLYIRLSVTKLIKGFQDDNSNWQDAGKLIGLNS